uniref:Uncharacterized protein n=1 Tax=Rhizophora mucronata TaxID=61149 RepID=A0A2P2PGM3_RHIMU
MRKWNSLVAINPGTYKIKISFYCCPYNVGRKNGTSYLG